MSRAQVKAIFVSLAVLVLAYAGVRLLGGDGRMGGGNDIAAAIGRDVFRGLVF